MQLRHLECKLIRDSNPPSLSGAIEGWIADDCWVSIELDSVAESFYFRVKTTSMHKSARHEKMIPATRNLTRVLQEAEIAALECFAL